MFATVGIAVVAECISGITEDCRPSLASGRCRDERVRSPCVADFAGSCGFFGRFGMLMLPEDEGFWRTKARNADICIALD
jgi:hypothetical protein